MSIQKKWLIVLQGLFISLAGVSILVNGFDKTMICLLFLASALTGIMFLTSNAKLTTIKIFKSLVTIEVIMSIASAIAFYIWGDSLANFILIFGFFSLFFGVIPFLFLFGILSSNTPLKFDMAKFRLLGGLISLIFGFYLIVGRHANPAETIKYIAYIMIIIGFSTIYGFILSQKIIDKQK